MASRARHAKRPCRSVSVRLASFGLALAVIVPLSAALPAAPAAAATFSNPSSIALNDPDSQSHFLNGQQVQNATATPFPSTISVSGMSGTISSMSLVLNNVTYQYSDDIDVLLVGPGGQTLIPIAAIGPNGGPSSSYGANDSTLTVSDSGTLPSATTSWGSSPDFRPVNYGQVPNGTISGENGFNEYWWAPAPAPPYGDPGQTGAATFASRFGGTNPNGTWSLYVITTSGGDGTGQIAGGWSLNITTASAAATTTSLASSNNPSFTSAPGNLVTLTATVSSTSTVSEGTVDFTDGGTTISGCGAQPVSSGQAVCTNTTFTTEGNHSLEAQYNGTLNFGPSNGSLTQQVNDHTTVTGNSYCNTGPVALNDPAVSVADASPYPSRVFVSGLSGALSDLTVTLNGATYNESQDIDALLVGPAGQSFILAAAAGPNSGGGISNVTLTLADSASSTIASGSVWGAANSSVTSRPFNYGGLNETWAAPAPAGPYGNPGPSSGGTATLGSTFDGTNPNGTWSLYVITTAAGDGVGQLAGGWCANISSANVASTTTAVSSNNNPSFTAAPGNSVTFTATVSSTSTVSEGTVNFTAGGTTIPDCGAQLVSAGQATCTTTFATEGDQSIEALYGGDANFGASDATLTQDVNDHTTVTGIDYCNTGTIALNNPPSTETGASPYPSEVFVSGVAGTLTHLAVSLNGVSYSESQDIDALLVGPGGQSFILVAAAGPNSGGALDNVTLTLDDAASSTLASGSAWGAANASVTSKPVNYGGVNEFWPSPAPAGPYGNPGPSGGGTATLGGTFDGTSPNGIWSLYVITTAAGDGTGQLAGGWCLDATAPASVSVSVAPDASNDGNYTVTAEALDGSGNLITSYDDPSPSWSDADGELGSQTPAGFVNGVSVTTGVSLPTPSKSDTITVTTDQVSGTSASFAVDGPLAQFAISIKGPVTAGQPFTVNFYAKDSVGNLLRGYTGTPTWSDTSGQLTGSPAAFSGGISTNTVTLADPVRIDKIVVTDGLVTNTSGAFNVLGPLARYRILPTCPCTTGEPFTVKIYAEDSLGDEITNYAGAPTWSDTSGQLTGSPAAFSGGLSTNQVTLSGPVHGDQIVATDGAVSSHSNSFSVFGPLAKYVIGVIRPVTAGQQFTVTITAEDSNGVKITNYAGTPTWSDSGGQLTGSPAAFSDGVSTNQVTLSNPSHADRITVTDGTVTDTGGAFNVLGPLARFEILTTGPYTAGQPFTVKIYAQDGLGDTITGYAGTPTWSDSSGQLTGSPAAFTNGLSTNQVTLGSAVNSDQITVTDSTISSHSASFKVQGVAAGSPPRQRSVPGRLTSR